MYEERPSRLDGVVVWTSVADGAHRVLPDGCMDLIWLGDRAVVAGADPVAHLSTVPAGTRCTGLRFAPGRLPPLLGVPASELTGLRVGLAEVWGPTTVDRMGDEVASGRGPAAVLESAVADRLPRSEPPDPHLRVVTEALAAGASVAATADLVGISPRQLQRRAVAAFGFGPKVLARILRLDRALDLARSGTSLASVAALAGYADQPHLAREVRDLAGVPLREVLAPGQPSPASGA